MDLSGGTSGSPIFDHEGWVIAVNNAGTEKLVIDLNTGAPARVPSGNIGFGIRADEMWDFIAMFESAKPARMTWADSRTCSEIPRGLSRSAFSGAGVPLRSLSAGVVLGHVGQGRNLLETVSGGEAGLTPTDFTCP